MQQERINYKGQAQLVARCVALKTKHLFSLLAVARASGFKIKQSDYRKDGSAMVCAHCDKRFEKYKSLSRHLKSVHYKLAYPCPHCEQRFATIVQRVLHKLEQHGIDDRFKCKACPAIFNQERRLRTHVRTYHMLGEKNKCDVCEYETFSLIDLQKHKVKHETVKDHHCKFCKKSFLRKKTLLLHERIHKSTVARAGGFKIKQSDYRKDGSAIVCAHCDQRFEKFRAVSQHLKSVHYKVAYPCSHCEQRFSSIVQRVLHKLEQHGVDDRFKCKACPAIFNQERQFRSHMSSNHMLGEKYKCDVCEYETFNLMYLKQHKVKHETVKDHQCKFCKKSFSRQSTLLLHERIHTGDRRKVCQVCGQAFVQKASLNYHMTKYHPEVNF